MSNQIRAVQILESTIDSNQIVALPRDLQTSSTDSTEEAVANIPSVSSVGDSTSAYGDFGGFNPATPSIMSVKSQTVNILDDGTATIDVVLVLEDITGVSEYDIRVAKQGDNV